MAAAVTRKGCWVRYVTLFLLLLTAAAPDLSGLGFTPHPGAQLPVGQSFTDASGAAMRLDEALGGRPGILALNYYTCPNLCGVVRADLFAALSGSGLDAARDVAVVALSIDPVETPRDAARARDAETRSGAPEGDWRFLTGDARAVTEAVGFAFRPDDRLRQFLHPAGLVVLTPRGVVSDYLLGVGYDPRVLRAAVLRAAAFGIARAPSPVLLLCFHYDPATGTYSLDILRAMRAAGAATAAALAGWLCVMHVRRRA